MTRCSNHPRRLFRVLALGGLLSAACGVAANLPVEGRLLVSITPGKPNAPTETVSASWREGRGTIRSERRGAGGEILAEGAGGLDSKGLTELWRTVERGGLTAFQPKESGARVSDFGSRRVELEWMPAPAAPKRSNAFSWQAPLANEEDVRPLLRAAGQAARAAVPGVQLAYFPEGPR
jgi:hypothetical protein